jgi:lipid II:glycine glycyltransferase (peptidoglycan interpeptide bridge formation enzyme)
METRINIVCGGGAYKIRVSDVVNDPDWDRFVISVPGGHHVQTSLWAQLKARQGWKCVRVILEDGDQIIGGAQVLARSYFGVGSIGYVQRGPVLLGNSLSLLEPIAEGLKRITRSFWIGLLYIEPPSTYDGSVDILERFEFRISKLQLNTLATTRIDLRLEPNVLLQSMRNSTRRNVIKASKSFLTVRDGSEKDISLFYDILQKTAIRQGFVCDSMEFFVEMWKLFHPVGFLKLNIVEHDGEVVATDWMVPFGNTVVSKRAAWNGRFGNQRPNDLLTWSSILWAREHGYSYYDFDGVRLSEPERTVSSFKLGFGGEVVPLPPTLENCSNAAFGIISRVISKAQSFNVVRRIIKRRW